jgi:hypothetical protein
MKKLIFLFLIGMLSKIVFGQNNNEENKYECLAETRVSGLFQFEKKFLKETDFFPNKTIMNFSEKYSLLTELESTKEKKFEAKYKFRCEKDDTSLIILCSPNDNNTYKITLSLETLRYRKILITNYWLYGRGNEVDYVHVANGYCYDID